MKAHRKEKARINYTSNRFNCGRRIRDERSEKNEKEEKKSGQGRLKGVERQVGLWSFVVHPRTRFSPN